MKFFALFTILAILVVCLLSQQSEASMLSRFGHDISHDADHIGQQAGQVVSSAGKTISNDAHDVGDTISANAPAIDKAANEIEPVAKVVATGIAIGTELDAQ